MRRSAMDGAWVSTKKRKVRQMTLSVWAPAAALCVSALVVFGCTTTGPRSMAAEIQSGSGHNENQFCSWTFGRGPDGKMVADSLQITNKPGKSCTRFDSGNTLFIGDSPTHGKEIVSIGPAEFVTKGSCRFCYFNTFGGMTCIVFNGAC
jgi:hypothetical protein